LFVFCHFSTSHLNAWNKPDTARVSCINTHFMQGREAK
jgi:hypothetical protein